jgi:hypothetical protein
MDIQQAQKISLLGLVASLGFQPVATQKGRFKCQSPFRPEEKEPSFYLYNNNEKGKWQWKDFGLNEKGGDIIDFIMKLYNVSEIGALMILDSPELSISTFSSFIGSSQNNHKSNIEIKHIQPLQNAALVQYLISRKISQAKAVNYVQEAYYSVNGKQYFALAFKNDKGGFELRNKYFKGSTSPKAPTTISGHKQAVNIFEGFIDFLSALEYYHTTKPTGTCIVLNSVSNLETIINSLEQYQQINLFLDNDPPENPVGQMAAETIKSRYPKVKDYAKIIYPDHKDFNEFITNTHKKSIPQ